jgi:hypothetical protein
MQLKIPILNRGYVRALTEIGQILEEKSKEVKPDVVTETEKENLCQNVSRRDHEKA